MLKSKSVKENQGHLSVLRFVDTIRFFRQIIARNFISASAASATYSNKLTASALSLVKAHISQIMKYRGTLPYFAEALFSYPSTIDLQITARLNLSYV